MKAVILAGGFGTRLEEETSLKPKPMIEIGNKPLLWHIMKIYSHFNINDFIICLGYKGYMIKEYFTNYQTHVSDLTVDLKNNKFNIHDNRSEDWKITLIDTGEKTQTGGRIKRIKNYVDGTFCLTYGDGVGNIDILSSLATHKKNKLFATMTIVKPTARFGAASIENGKIVKFIEKPESDDTWINAGFFVLEPEVFDYIPDDNTIFERDPLENLAKDGQLGAYKHNEFWHPVDTLRDKRILEELWHAGSIPWKIW